MARLKRANINLRDAIWKILFVMMWIAIVILVFRGVSQWSVINILFFVALCLLAMASLAGGLGYAKNGWPEGLALLVLSLPLIIVLVAAGYLFLESILNYVAAFLTLIIKGMEFFREWLTDLIY